MPTDISIVIPTFRRPEPLREALQSVLRQQGVSLEVQVCDDSPEGSARAVVESLGDERVHYHKRAVPTGGRPALVRNEGFRETSGRFVHFLDDDDRVCAQDTYRTAIDALEANPQRGVAFGRVQPFGDDPVAVAHEQAYFAEGARRARRAARTGSRHWMVANLLFKDTVLVNSACIIRSECFAALGGYNPALRVVEDVELYVRAIRRFGCVYLDRAVMEYRVLPGSLMDRETDSPAVAESYGLMYESYRTSYGPAEFFALKCFARGVLHFL
jgi:glycosyltransferase involved in cell wall biosynthesis